MPFKPHPTDPTKVVYKTSEYCIPKPWVSLTDEEIKEVLGLNEAPWSLPKIALQHVLDDVRAIEAKLKEKNNG